jgi:hypothetical protein
MGASGELSIPRFLVLSIWRFPTMRQTRSAPGIRKGTGLVRLRPFSDIALKDISKVRFTASRNVLLLIEIRDFVAHFGRLVEKGVRDFSIRGES